MNRPAIGSQHADHDLALVASILDRGADARARAAADLQVASCPDCARLLDDLRAISTGLRDLPRALPVPRDFTISPEQARRLRRGAGWRRLLRPFGARGVPSLQPLGAALTTLGLAGLLLSGGLPGFTGFLGGAASAPTTGSSVGLQPEGATSDKSLATPVIAVPGELNGATSPAPPAAPASGAPRTPTSPQAAFGPATAPSGEAVSRTSGGNGDNFLANPGSGEPATPRPPLAIISAALLIVGVGLLVLRFLARRLT